jgi:putative hydrolase of HD superfamily
VINGRSEIEEEDAMLRLNGKTIILRDWLEDDVEIYGKWLAPGRAWQKLDGPYYPTATAEEIPLIVEKLRGKITESNWQTPRTRMVIARDDRMIGQVSRYWISEETDWCAVGIVIYDEKLWGQGIGYEALGLWCDYLFHELTRFVRLDLRTWSGNLGMMRLALKLGFAEEARFRMARIVEGRYYDGMGYGVLRSEWEARYPDGFAGSL